MTKALLDTLDPIFADCLGDEDGRYTLTKPWIDTTGFVYATNGSILVRQPTKRTCPGDGRAPPNAARLFDQSKPIGKPITLPDIGPELGDKLICETCKGKDSTKTCNKCDGTGYHSCPTCKHKKPCRDCEGEGEWCCSGCGGEGTIKRDRQSIRLHPKHEFGLADYYVSLLQRHGIATVRRTDSADGPGFRFCKGKIEGLVLQMTLGADGDE